MRRQIERGRCQDVQISTEVAGKRMLVRLSDRMAFGDHAQFRTLLQGIAAAGVEDVIFDLSGLVSIDSAGLGMFMIALEASQTHGWRLRIVKPATAVRQLLQLARIDKLIEVTAA